MFDDEKKRQLNLIPRLEKIEASLWLHSRRLCLSSPDHSQSRTVGLHYHSLCNAIVMHYSLSATRSLPTHYFNWKWWSLLTVFLQVQYEGVPENATLILNRHISTPFRWILTLHHKALGKLQFVAAKKCGHCHYLVSETKTKLRLVADEVKHFFFWTTFYSFIYLLLNQEIEYQHCCY